MKLLTTAIFLILSLVMMNAALAQDDAEFIVAFKEQTAAIEKQTEAIKEQTLMMKAIALTEAWSYNLGRDDEYLIYIDETINKVIAYIKANQ